MKSAVTDATSRARVERLRSIPIFSELGEEALLRILDRATEFEAAPGHVLVQPHAAGAGLFVIEDGTATVELRDKKLDLGPGEFFGELALLNEDATHTGRVCASTSLKCLAINRDDFAELLETEPAIAKAMLRALARRLSSSYA